MIVCQVFIWFVLYSILGWIWESTYCTIVEGSWQNRGFLYGPYCPIYGTGILGIMLLWHQVLEQGTPPAWYEVFLVVMVGSAVLEYFTHWALEKLFHAYWWDYSNMPLNINGRICLPASIFFGLGGLLVVYVLYQPTARFISSADPIITELFSLALMAMIAADTAITASSLASIARAASSINNDINAHMDRLVASAGRRYEAAADSISESRDGAMRMIRAAGASVLQREEELVKQAEAESAERAQVLADERERFAERRRSRQITQMGSAVLRAARRAKGFVPSPSLPNTPSYEQLSKLWRDILTKK